MTLKSIYGKIVWVESVWRELAGNSSNRVVLSHFLGDFVMSVNAIQNNNKLFNLFLYVQKKMWVLLASASVVARILWLVARVFL